MRFIIEIDANMLMAQFNRSVADFSEVLIIRWLTWIKFFDFDVKHVFDKKHTAVDDFSRRFQDFSNDIDEIHEENIDDFINEQLNCARVCFINVNEIKKKLSLKKNYFKKSQRIAQYLIILIWFNKMNRKIFRKFKNWALQFLIRDKQLFKRTNKNVFFKWIVDEIENQQKILKQLHDENKHKNWKDIYRRVTDRYWWRNLYKDCKKYVVSCNVCQRKKLNRKKKTLHFTWMSTFFKKIGINCVHMSASEVMKTIMIIWDDLIEWMKARALFNFKIDTIVKFIWQNVISRHECFDIAILNKDFENKKIIKQLL